MCPKIFYILLLWTPVSVCSQIDTGAMHKGVQVKFHYGFIFAHSQAVQNTAGAYPRGIELEFIKQKNDTATWDVCHCYPTKGFSFSYFNYNNRVLGHGLTGSYFLQPSYRIGKRAQFLFRGSAGLSYLTNPYDPNTNPTNVSYSTHLSGYLQVGAGAGYQIAPLFLVSLMANYQHVSNGGLKEPNKGINWPTASIGISYFKAPYQLLSYKRRIAERNFSTKTYMEVGMFVSARQGVKPAGETPRTPLVGVIAQASRQVGRTNAINTGLELYYDNSLYQKLKADSLEGSAMRAGFLAGHEFLLGKFLFSQQLGVYLYKKNPYYSLLYHRWTFKYQLNRKWLVGIGLNAHKQVADFVDARLLYRM